MREETNIKKDKNNYTIWEFIFTTLIITYAMGGFIAYGYYTGRDIGFLCTVQMLYPALTAVSYTHLLRLPIPFLPTQIYKVVPYIVTAIVLIVVSMRQRREDQPPQSLGLNYFREER